MKIGSNTFTSKRKSTSVYLALVFAFLLLALGISITLAFFFDTDYTSGYQTMSGKVQIEAVGTGNASIEDTTTESKLVITLEDLYPVLIPGMKINLPANCMVYQSTTMPLLRAKFEFELIGYDSLTEAGKTMSVNAIEDMTSDLFDIINGNKWYQHTDGYYYYGGTHYNTTDKENMLLQEVDATDGNAVVNFINAPIEFPKYITSEFSKLGVKIIITFQGIQNYIPIPEGETNAGYQKSNTIKNSQDIFEAFDNNEDNGNDVELPKPDR